VGDRTTLNQLFALVRYNLVHFGVAANTEPENRDFRMGDARHSKADISKASRLLGYSPVFDISVVNKLATSWYADFFIAKLLRPKFNP
jgi:UDP-N-acetylglucosamine 4-epimerase